MLSTAEQLKIIASGVSDIIPLKSLQEKLDKKVPLRIKLGVDPTAPDLHLGHAVPLRKMRQFQDLGHQVVLIIGDATALIGDPSGRNSTRPPLTEEQVKANAATYVEQAEKILDPAKTELVWNSEWIYKLDLQGILNLTSNFTVARILERDDFSNRYANQQPIALHEFLYPTLQAYDSVMVKADVEMGGSDQLFNLLAGRELMTKLGMEPQVCLTLPLLEGTDGVHKMSKSYGNYIGLTDAPSDMFGKVMSIPDELMIKYYRLASTEDVDKIDELEKGLAAGTVHPNVAKRALARNIVEAYYNAAEAQAAEAEFDKVFKRHDIPDDVQTAHVSFELNDQGLVYLPALMKALGLETSASEGRKRIDGGGVKIDGEALPAKQYNVAPEVLDGHVLQVGKRKFIKISTQ